MKNFRAIGGFKKKRRLSVGVPMFVLRRIKMACVFMDWKVFHIVCVWFCFVRFLELERTKP